MSISCLIPELTLHPLAPTIDPRTAVSVLVTCDPDNCAHPGVVCYAPLSRALINSFTPVPVVAENGRVNETVVALLVPTILKYRIPIPIFIVKDLCRVARPSGDSGTAELICPRYSIQIAKFIDIPSILVVTVVERGSQLFPFTDNLAKCSRESFPPQSSVIYWLFDDVEIYRFVNIVFG